MMEKDNSTNKTDPGASSTETRADRELSDTTDMYAGPGVSEGSGGFTDPTESYFDRERWYDVETQELSPVAASAISFGDNKTGLSAFSVTVLGTVALVAGVLGVLAIHFLPTLPFEHPPIQARSDYRSVPQQWIGYQQASVYPVNAPNGTCFFVDEEHRIFLGAERQIIVYSEHGIYLQALTLPDVPQAMVLSDNRTILPGKLFVAYRDHVEVYSLFKHANQYELNLYSQWPAFEGGADLRSITLSPDAAYLGDAGEKVVYQCNPQGKLLRRIGFPAGKISQEKTSKDKADDHPEESFEGFVVLAVPTLSVAYAHDSGILYVANPGKHRIEAFTPDGHWESALSWGDASAAFTGFCGCCNPVGLQVLDNGLLLTVEKSVNRIKLYDKRGKLSAVVAPSEQLDRLPRSLVEIRGRDVPRNLIPNASTTPVIAALQGEFVYVFDPVFQIVHTFYPLSGTTTPEIPTPETSPPDAEPPMPEPLPESEAPASEPSGE